MTKKHKIIIMDRMTKKGTGTDERVRSIWEIFNKCPRNQMRDVFVEEVEIADPEAYVKQKFRGRMSPTEKTVLETEPSFLDIQTSMIRQRCSFTEI